MSDIDKNTGKKRRAERWGDSDWTSARFPLVSAAQLHGALGSERLRIIDATFNPFQARDRAATDFSRRHLPDAVYLELDTLHDQESSLPNMLPTSSDFESRMAGLGISNDDIVVLYDNSHCRTAARAWWMFRMFGVADVWILDGGLSAWLQSGYATTSGRTKIDASTFQAHAPIAGLRTKASVEAALRLRSEQIVDARSTARFLGTDPDPHGLPSGHICGSFNVPFSLMLDDHGYFQRAERLRATFHEAGVDPSRPITATCGSGVSAAILYVAAVLCGSPEPGLYDGSWSEWSRAPSGNSV